MKNQMILTPFYLDRPLQELENLGTENWVINKPDLPDGVRQHRMSAIHKPLADFARHAIETDLRPISIAGDCCTSIGMMAALQDAGIDPPLLIWFDAHGDFNTWETSPSGFLGGMPLAMIVGTGEQSMLNALNIRPLPEERVILTDARDLDPGEKLLIEASNIVHLTDVKDLLNLDLLDAPLYIHFDTDIITPAEAPAMNYLTAGGPSVKNLHTVMKYLNQTKKIVAVSMSTWNPEMDKDGQSRQACMHLLDALIGD